MTAARPPWQNHKKVIRVVYNLFEYVDTHGSKVFSEWRDGLQKAQQAQLDNKVNMLRTSGANLGPRLLANTRGHIRKLRVNGNVQLRPRLCPGPINNDTEFSFLLGAVERDMKDIPPKADDLAESRRNEIIADSKRRTVYVRK